MSIKDSVISKLLVNARFVTREQLSEAVEAQELMSDDRGNKPRLFDVLLQKGYISREQLQTVLEGYDERTKRLFGEIAIKWNLIGESQIEECLALQQTMKDSGQKVPRIGQLLVSRNYLKKHQVKAILEEQNKKIANCPGCGASFNVRSVEESGKIKCSQCGKLLTFPKDKEAPIEADATVVREVQPLFKEAPAQKPRSQFGEFKILGNLGQDSTGSIYQAQKAGEERVVALKIFNKDTTEDAEYVDTLKKNVQRSARLAHPNLKKVYAMGAVDGAYYVATEFIEGESLRNILQRDGTISVKKALVICARVAEALKYVHEHGGIHEDVRPSNILVSTEGRVVLSNLGLTPKITDNILTIVDSGQLAPFYIAPEQVVEDRPVDYRADVYSLGCTLYHLVAGRPPFEGQSPFEVLIRFTEDFFPPPQVYNPAVPQQVARIIEKMVAAEPDDRYQDLSELVHDLTNPKEARFEGEVHPDESSDAMRALMNEDSGLGHLARTPSPGMPLWPVLLGIGAVLAGVALYFGVFAGRGGPGGARSVDEAFASLEQAYKREIHDFARQPSLLERCKVYLDKHPDSPQTAQVRGWITEVEKRRADMQRNKVAAYKQEVAGAIRDRNFPRARMLWERDRAKHDFPGWTEAAAELDRAIAAAEKQQFDDLLGQARQHEKAGKLNLAVEVFDIVPRMFLDPRYAAQAKAEVQRLRKEMDKQQAAAQDEKRRQSIERAQAGIEASRKLEATHEYTSAIHRLKTQVMKAVQDEHKPLLERRIQELAWQQSLFAKHLGRVDLNKHKGLTCLYNSTRFPINQMKPDGLWLKGLNSFVRWRQVEDAEILRLALATTQGARLEEARFQAGIFAHCHSLDFDALRVLSEVVQRRPEARPYFDAVRQKLDARIDGEIGGLVSQPDPRKRLLAALALELRYGAALEVLAAQAGKLNAQRKQSFQQLAGPGKLLDFDAAPDLAGSFKLEGRAAAHKREHGNGYLQLAQGGVEAKWTPRGSLFFLVRVREGSSKLELRYGKLTAIFSIDKVSAELRVTIFSGAHNESLQLTLARGYGAWYLVELRDAGGALGLFLDGQRISTKPFAAGDAAGRLELKVKTAVPMDFDLIQTGE